MIEATPGRFVVVDRGWSETMDLVGRYVVVDCGWSEAMDLVGRSVVVDCCGLAEVCIYVELSHNADI